MSASIQVISTNNYDGSPLIVFSTETERLVFNCGEGTQRLCAEHKVRLQKVDRIFFTALNHESIFGLPGMSLTLADGGKKAFSFYGPPSMDRFWASTRRFMYRPDLSVSIYDATTSGPVRCKESTIHPVPFENKSSIGISSRFYLSYICETPPKAGKFDVARAAALGVPKGPLFAKLKCGEDVTLPDGLVVRSIDVVEQADPGRCCAIVAAVDLSGVGESPLEDFCNLPQWKRFQEGGPSYGLLDCMMHLSSASIVSSAVYVQWMRSFGAATGHVLVGRDAGQPISAFQASTRHSRKLSKFEPRLFPPTPLRLNGSGDGDIEYVSSEVAGEFNMTIKRAAPLLKYTLVPKTQRGWSEGTVNSPQPLTDLNIDAEAEEHFNTACTDDVLRLRDALIAAKDSCESERIDCDADSISSNDPAALLLRCPSNSIVFLGTGCAIPSKYRNVSSALIETPRGSILLDAGEGTWHQLIRASTLRSSGSSSRDGILRVAQSLRLIWISHPHADHHLGIVTIILERKRLLAASAAPGSNPSVAFVPLVLVAPPSILSFVKDYAELDPSLCGAYIGISTSKFDPSDDAYVWDTVEESARDIINDANGNNMNTSNEKLDRNSEIISMLDGMGISKLTNVKVNHCFQAFGVRIWSKEGWSVVYSGDTRPCAELEELGRGATILIHEATFDDSKPDEAIQKKHSTQSEAVDVHKNMGSYRLLLTHFSQRYPNIPMTNEVLSKSTEGQPGRRFAEKHADPIFAFDCMRIAFPDLLWAPSASALLAAAFPQEDDATGEEGDAEDGDAPLSYVRSQCDACLQCRVEEEAVVKVASGGVQVCSTDAVAVASSAPRPVRCPHVNSTADGGAQRKKLKLA